ncbi:phospholipase D family protein [Rhizobium sp. IY2]|uniref:phospholipase D family protein n=1 Tax=Rhizobium sp. IY2 TaxID=3397853 RepID=UPI0039DF84F0
MNVEFLEANAIRLRLRRYMEEYDEFHWAVAWGSHPGMAKRLFTHRSKFRNVTFGVAFSQTDPDVVDALVGVANGYVATKFAGGTYHPKIYSFRTGRRVAAVVGSANFTGGGLGANLEAAVALTGTMDDPALSDIIAFARTSAGYGRQVTQPYADAYRASCVRAGRLPKAPRDPVPEGRVGAAAAIMKMDWDEYVRRVRASRHHDMARSLELIAIARRWFATEASFARFSPEQRKAVAGILGEYQKVGPDLDREWGWFGSMRGAGDFANRIEQNDRSLSKALDSIPSGGEVTRAQYERFCRLFRQAFARSSRTGGVPTATRLLSMKRPDTFLCVCKPNIVQAAKELGFARTTLDLDNYWERVVEPISLSTWYNADKPDHPDGELWEARAAMLDTLFYRP